MTAEPAPWRATGDGLLVRVRSTPKAAQDVIGAIAATADGPALEARVRAAPRDGEANAAVAKLVALWLGVPKSTVALAAGTRSRVKTLTVMGDGTALALRAEARLGRDS